MIEFAIQIPDDLKPFIDQSVKSGLFSDVEDFVVNVLYSVRAQSEAELPEDQKARLAALRAEIAIGIEQADRGDFVEFTAEDVIAAGRARRAAAA
ncbi:MAG TPA: hypothetical protein VG796_07955 [Verrucomicrobiales bacterium]|nr:hypothetical protein [Verrucomicrobiales bacterium]